MPRKSDNYSKLVRWSRRQRKPWQRRDVVDAIGVNSELAKFYIRKLIVDGGAEMIGYAVYQTKGRR
jgi:hypothetical protein